MKAEKSQPTAGEEVGDHAAPLAIAVLLAPRGSLIEGQLVQGPAAEIGGMVEAGGARLATEAEIALAAHFIFPLPEA